MKPTGEFEVIETLARKCPKCSEVLQMARATSNDSPAEWFRYVRCSNSKCDYTERVVDSRTNGN